VVAALLARDLEKQITALKQTTAMDVLHEILGSNVQWAQTGLQLQVEPGLVTEPF
jgi:hypothetical protein